VRWCSAGGGKVPLSPSGNNQIVAPIGGGILSNVNSTIAGAGSIGGGLTVVNSGTINANTVSTLQLNASTINAGRLEATASAGTLILAANISNTGTGTILASGSGAHIVLNGAVISGGKLQTQAGGEIDVINGLLSDATIASGSIVDINGTLALSGRIANSGLISALGSPFATLAISGAVLLSGGGNVSLSPSGNNQIVAAPGGGILSNVNNTIAGAGFIGGGLTVVNSGTINANTVSTLQLNASTINAGKLEATASGGTLILAANISNTGTGTILASGSGARVDFNNATILCGKLQTSGRRGDRDAKRHHRPAQRLYGRSSEFARGDEQRDAEAERRNDRRRSGCRDLDRRHGVGHWHRPQFRHPVRERLQQCGPDHERRRGHGRRCRDRRRHRLCRRVEQRKRCFPGERKRRAGLERVRQSLHGQGFRIRFRQFRALGPRSVHRLRQCQLHRRNRLLHLGKSIQYQRYAYRHQWRQFGERASRRQLQCREFHELQRRQWPHQDHGSRGVPSGGGTPRRRSWAPDTSAGVHGGAVVTEAPQTAGAPLLAHPHM
jgi:hypothetical protein